MTLKNLAKSIVATVAFTTAGLVGAAESVVELEGKAVIRDGLFETRVSACTFNGIQSGEDFSLNVRTIGDVAYLEVIDLSAPSICPRIGGAVTTIDLQLSFGSLSTEGLKFVVLNPIVTDGGNEIPSAQPINPPVVTTKPARPSNNNGGGFYFQ